jgi:hypothetical protein
MPVSKTELGTLEPLAKGGFGQVFRVGENPFPADPTPLAYKEFTSNFAAQRRSAQLAVAFRDDLKPDEREDLDRCTVWPRDLVLGSDGKFSGLLMRLIPDDFRCELREPKTGEKATKVRDLQWLGATQAQRSAAEIDLRDIEQLERRILVGKLIYAIGRLHKHRWVFGDLSFRNAAFALNPPRTLLLDCDGAAPLSDTKRKQASTLNWDPPECSLDVPADQRWPQDDITDVYKLGLAILRCLAPGKGMTSTRNPNRLAGQLDPEGVALVRRALGDNRADRPTAKELYGYFYKIVSPAVRPPEVHHAVLLTPKCVRGMDARVEWQIRNAEQVRLTTGGNDSREVDLASHQDGYTIENPVPGPVFIEVTNRYGTKRLDLGEITFYEPPEFKPVDFGALPRPVVPRLKAFTLEHMGPVLDAVPAVVVPEVPAVPPLPTVDLIENFKDTLMRGSGVPLPLPRLDEAVTAASRLVTSSVMEMAKERAVAQRQEYLASQAEAGSAGREAH